MRPSPIDLVILIAYVAAIFCLQIAAPLVQLLSQPSVFFRWNGALVLIFSLLVLAWMFAVRSRTPQSESAVSG